MSNWWFHGVEQKELECNRDFNWGFDLENDRQENIRASEIGG